MIKIEIKPIYALYKQCKVIGTEKTVKLFGITLLRKIINSPTLESECFFYPTI